jgi:hypothetical protein
LICESTFGVHTLPDRRDKEEQFTSEFHSYRAHQPSCPTLSSAAASASCLSLHSATAKSSPSCSTSTGTTTPSCTTCQCISRRDYSSAGCACTRRMCTR